MYCFDINGEKIIIKKQNKNYICVRLGTLCRHMKIAVYIRVIIIKCRIILIQHETVHPVTPDTVKNNCQTVILYLFICYQVLGNSLIDSFTCIFHTYVPSVSFKSYFFFMSPSFPFSFFSTSLFLPNSGIFNIIKI